MTVRMEKFRRRLLRELTPGELRELKVDIDRVLEPDPPTPEERGTDNAINQTQQHRRGRRQRS